MLCQIEFSNLFRRTVAASPACASVKLHQAQLDKLMADALQLKI